MSKFRNVSSDARIVGVGLSSRREIAPDAILEVSEEVTENYLGQEAIWEFIDEPAINTSSTDKGDI